jgi:hypothetical protein
MSRNIILTVKDHVASAVLMVKPTDFKFNVETAEDNDFMQQVDLTST